MEGITTFDAACIWFSKVEFHVNTATRDAKKYCILLQSSEIIPVSFFLTTRLDYEVGQYTLMIIVIFI